MVNSLIFFSDNDILLLSIEPLIKNSSPNFLTDISLDEKTRLSNLKEISFVINSLFLKLKIKLRSSKLYLLKKSISISFTKPLIE